MFFNGKKSRPTLPRVGHRIRAANLPTNEKTPDRGQRRACVAKRSPSREMLRLQAVWNQDVRTFTRHRIRLAGGRAGEQRVAIAEDTFDLGINRAVLHRPQVIRHAGFGQSPLAVRQVIDLS